MPCSITTEARSGDWPSARSRRTSRGRDTSTRRLAALRAGDASDLRSAGLAAHLDAGHFELAAARGAGAVHHFPHAAAHRLEMLPGEGKGLRRRVIAADDARLDVEPGGDPPRHHRELQRIDDDEALADRGVERVGLGPVRSLDELAALLVTGLLPGRARHRAVILRHHRQVELLAEAEALAHRGNDIDAGAAAHGVEIGVAALGDGGVHGHRAMAPEAAEEAVAELEAARAVDSRLGIDARLKQRHGDHRLEGRAGWVEAVQRLVEQRLSFVLREHLPFVLTDAVGKIVGIVSRHRGQCEQIAGQAVEHHDRTGFLTKPPCGIGLEARVDGEGERLAAFVGQGGKLPHQTSPGGDLHPLRARLAAQPGLHRLLQAFLADLEAWGDQKRELVFRKIFLPIGRADIADQMRDGGAVRVEARKGAQRRHPRKLRQPDRHRGIFLERQVLRDRHRLVSGGARQLFPDSRDLVGGRSSRRASSARIRSGSFRRSGIRSTRKSLRLIAIGMPARSITQPRRGGMRRIWTRFDSDSRL
jgi:hypothetical protein